MCSNCSNNDTEPWCVVFVSVCVSGAEGRLKVSDRNSRDALSSDAQTQLSPRGT